MTLFKQAQGANPLIGWHLDPDEVSYVGSDLQPPECILAVPDGTLFTADARGGVVEISPDGRQRIISQGVGRQFDLSTAAASSLLTGTLPNGLAFDERGDFLIS